MTWTPARNPYAYKFRCIILFNMALIREISGMPCLFTSFVPLSDHTQQTLFSTTYNELRTRSAAAFCSELSTMSTYYWFIFLVIHMFSEVFSMYLYASLACLRNRSHSVYTSSINLISCELISLSGADPPDLKMVFSLSEYSKNGTKLILLMDLRYVGKFLRDF